MSSCRATNAKATIRPALFVRCDEAAMLRDAVALLDEIEAALKDGAK